MSTTNDLHNTIGDPISGRLLFPIRNVAALFANAQMRTVAHALRSVPAGGRECMDRAIADAATRLQTSTRNIRGIREQTAVRFAADLDRMGLIPDEVFTSPRVGWTYGRLAGLSAIVAIGAVARTNRGSETACVAAFRRGLKEMHTEAAALWSQHVREMLIGERLPTEGAVANVDVSDLDAPCVRVSYLRPAGAED